ncbi:hypothetical protein [Actinokineospora cianjurensis]|nr:hypothetical protein [Actinokineospora cianjurensis]
MKLPQLVDYQQALQIPQVSFAEPDLRRGEVRRNQLQVPDSASGASR